MNKMDCFIRSKVRSDLCSCLFFRDGQDAKGVGMVAPKFQTEAERLILLQRKENKGTKERIAI